MKTNKKKGFTLVELIAVIAIIGILAAIIIPKFSTFTNSAKENRTIADMRTIVSAANLWAADNPNNAADIEDDNLTALKSKLNTGSKVYIENWADTDAWVIKSGISPTFTISSGTLTDMKNYIAAATKTTATATH